MKITIKFILLKEMFSILSIPQIKILGLLNPKFKLLILIIKYEI